MKFGINYMKKNWSKCTFVCVYPNTHRQPLFKMVRHKPTFKLHSVPINDSITYFENKNNTKPIYNASNY